ncbi:hypothetical protein ACPTKN_13355 [Enterococcus faecalis]|uniref:hypothetical protein n=1 Tax=Enterococcus faecalis TaxID=1351 RepID=UPI003CC58344
MKPTRFFLFSGDSESYYALIKGVDYGFSFEIYKINCPIRNREQPITNVKEISLSEAINEMKRLPNEYGKMVNDQDILEQLVDEQICLLGIDFRLV